MKGPRRLMFVAVMAALANILSYPPIAVPLVIGPFESSIHFSQLPVFLCGIIAGPLAGLLAGGIGGSFMAFTKIPFIVGGIAILGCAAGLFAKKLRPFLAGILAWAVQAPYVVVTDYIWFTLFLHQPPTVAWSIVFTMVAKLTIEAVVCSVLAEILAPRISISVGSISTQTARQPREDTRRNVEEKIN